MNGETNESDELVAAIGEAKRLVEAAGLKLDEPLAVPAFERLLDRALGTASRPAPTSPDESSADLDSPVARIARWTEIDGAQLGDILVADETGVDFDLWSRTLPDRKADRQRLLVLLKTGLDRVGWDRDLVPSTEINALCSKYDCLDQNLPANLQKASGLISRRGQRGSYEYRITHAGLQAARDELRRIAVQGQ